MIDVIYAPAKTKRSVLTTTKQRRSQAIRPTELKKQTPENNLGYASGIAQTPIGEERFFRPAPAVPGQFIYD